MLNIISLGAGVQSSTMALMAAAGEIQPMPDAAIYAQTADPVAVRLWLDQLERLLPFPVYRVSAGSLEEAVTYNDFNPVPMYTNNGRSMGRRQCTREYKIAPIMKQQRELAGLAKGERAGEVRVIDWQGISQDEIQRARAAPEVWREMRYPLLELKMTRSDCIDWLTDNDYGVPPRSACYFCPYRSNADWKVLQADEDEWLRALQMDSIVRERGEYLHASGPLAEANLNEYQQDLFDEECQGMCGL